MRRNLIVMVSGDWRKTWSEYTCTASQVRQLPGQHGRVSPLWHGQTHSGWHRGLHWGCGRGVPREQLRGWPRQAVWLPAAWEPDHEDGGLCVPGDRPNFPSTCGTSCLSLTCLIVQDVPTMEACRDLCLTAPYRWVSWSAHVWSTWRRYLNTDYAKKTSRIAFNFEYLNCFGDCNDTKN